MPQNDFLNLLYMKNFNQDTNKQLILLNSVIRGVENKENFPM